MKRIPVALLLVASVLGCKSSSSDSVLEGSLLILQRAPRTGGVGDIFQYTSYIPGARILKLTPPSADGHVSVVCCEQFPGFEELDISSYDLAFDARAIVFSGRLSQGERYGLFVVPLDEHGDAAGPPAQLATDPNHHYVYPIFAPGGRIVFVTTAVVEEGAKQHRDEYNRGTTTQLGSIAVDGTDEILGPRNLSHRVFPTMLADGRILFTQWDHVAEINSGHLMIANPDLTNLREAFGKEGRGVTNSYLKAIEIEPGRLVAIGTARERTVQAGKILDVRLGRHDDQGVWRQSEAESSVVDLTPLVPRDREPSQNTVGRYYDAYPLRDPRTKEYGERPWFVVSWADGPVESQTLGAAGLFADFGIYLFDSRTGARRPIYNTDTMWEVQPRPLATRPAPDHIEPAGKHGYADDRSFLIGSMNVYDSTIMDVADGEIVRVRILEGYSSEEGIPNDFGLTEHEGSALLGEAPVHGDGSWAALVPANVPLRLQTIDRFGMAIVSENVWFSGRPGESRFCGGCHEDRARTTVIQPGITEAIAIGPIVADAPRAQRRSLDFGRDAVVGVPWDKALQAVFDARCVSCHDGDPDKPGNKSLTFTDPASGETQTIVFDLRGHEVSYGAGEAMVSGYSASHLSLLGPKMMELAEAGITVSGDMPVYVETDVRSARGSARRSALFEKLNPPQLYPYDPAVRWRAGAPVHPVDVGGADLTEDEWYLLILMADSGGQFYSRENAPGSDY